ncbi:MAG: EAL domain-containing protein, partial [Bulleidia sp.]
MDSPYYVVLYLACEILCLAFVLVMAGKMNSDIGSVDEVLLFRRLSLCSVLEAASESLWMLSKSLIPGMPRFLLYASCLGDLLCTGYLVCSWYLFLDYKIVPHDRLLKRTRWMSFLRVLPIVILTVMDCASLINHRIFYLTESGEYVRGQWYFIHAFLCFFYFAMVIRLLSEGRKYSTVNRQELRLYLQFSILLVTGGILQILAGNVPFTLLFFTFGMFMIFSSLQSRQIDTDALTKLNNHTRGFAWIHSRIPDADQKPFYLFMADIDGFKKINDSYGHIQGDEAILLTADTLRKLAESYPSMFISRFGGDEFLFGVMCDESEPQVLIQQFAQLLSDALDSSALPFRFTMSVGYMKADQTNVTERELVAEADRALYLQKDRINHHQPKETFHEAIPEPPVLPKNSVQKADPKEMEDYILSHLDEALAKGWITPYFQPVVRTITEEYAGAEALARWIDPVYGNIMPGTFVPVLEKAGLIYRIDCHMLETVLKGQRKRLDEGLPVFTISINLSRQDFEKQDMVSLIRNLVSKYRIQKDLIALELTESM